MENDIPLATIVSDLPRLASPAQVARALGVDAGTIRRYVATGRLAALKFGTDRRSPVRIPRQAVEQFLREALAANGASGKR